MDPSSIGGLGENPWNKLFFANNAMFSTFMATPFVVLFISAVVFIEHQSNAWKFQYTSPVSRISIVLSKLITFTLSMMAFFLVLSIMTIVVGYLLDFFLPELEFSFNRIGLFSYYKASVHLFISLLGIIAIQFFLSYQFKGFLVPASFGILSFILGLILGTVNNPAAKFFPYSFPLVSKDVGMFNNDGLNIIDYGFINSIQLSSIIFFLIFTILLLIFESRKNIK